MHKATNKSLRILSVVGFSVLATFFAVGVAWLVIGILAVTFKSHGDSLIAGSLPILTASGAVGFVLGLVVSLRLVRSDPKTEQEVERRFVGKGGRGQIYFGAPMFIIALGSPFFLGRLTQVLGDREGAYLWLGFIAVVLVLSFVIRDHIPERAVIPIGIIGWLLVVLLAIGFAVYMSRQPM